MKKRTEQMLMNKIIEYLRIKSFDVYRVNSGNIQTKFGTFVKLFPRGFPDIMFLDNYGNAYFLEIKTPLGRVSPEQKSYISSLRNRGFRADIVRSLDEVDLFLKGKFNYEN